MILFPLSNDTVSRRIDDIAEDVEQQLFGKLRDKLFSIQLDKATDSNKDAHFISYVRFWDAQRKNLDDFLRGRIIERLECERTQLEVFEELGIAQSFISRLWQGFHDDGNVSRCYSPGHPRVTTPNEDRYLAVTAKRNRRSTTSDLSRQLSSATGTAVSRQTVYRRLGHIADVFHLPQLTIACD
ncbi:HTH_Tnp_Tc3_2 domain-containing protein [Trichonephila clavipes]|nr:HTH_Tnp_Tc3_2 domain-containing protein [Trichonephila clavipes]